MRLWVSLCKIMDFAARYSCVSYAFQRVIEGGQKLGACLHTFASPEYPHGRIFTAAEYDRQAVRKAQKDTREKSRLATEKVGYPEKDTRYVACGGP
jgi:hypothetical protein